jgi:hypothetical protein
MKFCKKTATNNTTFPQVSFSPRFPAAVTGAEKPKDVKKV